MEITTKTFRRPFGHAWGHLPYPTDLHDFTAPSAKPVMQIDDQNILTTVSFCIAKKGAVVGKE
jgi:hypothetical protein